MEAITAYALARGFTKETADSLGSLKGAPCTVDNIEQKDGYAEITLGWTGTDGKHKTSSFTVNDGVSITSVTFDDSKHLFVTMSDGKTIDAGVCAGDIPLSERNLNALKLLDDGYFVSEPWRGSRSEYESQKHLIPDGTVIIFTDDTPADQIIDDVSPSGHKAFSSQKVLSLLANRLSTKEVSSLPVSDIRSDTIYLVPSGKPGVYDQFIYDDGKWQSLGNTSPNFENKADSEAVNAELEKKVDKENGKGLSTNDLTDVIKQKYDDAADKSHEHENKVILDRLSASKAGVLCYDGKEVVQNTIVYENKKSVDTGKKWIDGSPIYLYTAVLNRSDLSTPTVSIPIPSPSTVISYEAYCYYYSSTGGTLVYKVPYSQTETDKQENFMHGSLVIGAQRHYSVSNIRDDTQKLIFTMEYVR